MLNLKKSDPQNPRKWQSSVIKLDILDIQAQANRKKKFCQQFLNSVKVEEKIIKINLST